MPRKHEKPGPISQFDRTASCLYRAILPTGAVIIFSQAHFLGVPDVGAWLFAGLMMVSLLTTILGTLAGTGGGLVLLATMAMVFPPAILVPVHTVVQLAVGTSRAIIMWR